MVPETIQNEIAMLNAFTLVPRRAISDAAMKGPKPLPKLSCRRAEGQCAENQLVVVQSGELLRCLHTAAITGAVVMANGGLRRSTRRE